MRAKKKKYKIDNFEYWSVEGWNQFLWQLMGLDDLTDLESGMSKVFTDE